MKHSANAVNENEQSRPQSVWVIIILSMIPLIMVLGNSMLIPVLPAAQKALKINQFQVSLLITLFSIPAGLIIPLTGILSDRIGRKKIIVPSLLIYGLGGVIVGLAIIFFDQKAYPWVLAGRIIQGIGAAGTAPIAMALVSDLYQSRERSKALGIIEASNGMGKVVSPIAGSLLALITWYALFFAFPILCIPIALLVWYVIKEPITEKDKPKLSQYRNMISKTFKRQGKWLIIAFLAGAVTLFVLFGVLFYLSDTLEKTYKIDGIKKGLVLAIPLLSMVSSAFITGVLVQRRGKWMKALVITGLIIVALISGAVPFIKNNIILISFLFVGGIGSGMVLPCLNTMITSAVGKEERGIITSLYSSLRFLGVAAGPPIFGAFMDHKQILFLSVGGLALLAAFLSSLFLRRPHFVRGVDDQQRMVFRKRATFARS